MHHRTSIICAVLLSLAVLGHVVPVHAAGERLILKAAVPADFPPQYAIDPTGKPAGFAIDVMREIARLANAEVTFVVKDGWSEAIDALQTGEVDLIPNQGVTARRRAWFAFTSPVETFPVRIFTRSGSEDIRSADDLANRKVGVIRLNVGETLMANKPGITLVTYDHIKDALYDLLAGSVDAVVFPEPVFRLIARRVGLENRIKAVGPPLIEIKRAISVRKTDAQLLHRLEGAVNKFVGSVAYQKIYSRWYGETPPMLTTRQMAALMVAILLVVITAMAFWRYRSLVNINKSLEDSIRERELAERELKGAHDRLEERVQERTEALSSANAVLTEEIRRRREAEQQLRENERFLSDIIEFLPDPTWVIDTGGRVTAWNRAMQRTTGIPKDDMIGRGDYAYAVPFYGTRRPLLIDLVLKRDPEVEKLYLSLREEDGLLRESESFHPTMGDGGRYFSGTAARLYDDQGNVVGAIESLRDITAAKNLEQEREHLIEDLSAALDKVRTLSGLLPICSSCKKIRDDQGYWKQIESYISEHSRAEFSHSICPDCVKKLYPDVDSDSA